MKSIAINRRGASILAWSIIAISLLMMGASIILAYLGRTVELPADWGPWYSVLIYAPTFMLTLILSGFIISRLPQNAFGWVFMCLGFGVGVLVPLGQYYCIYALGVASPPLPFAWEMANLGGFGWFVSITMMPMFLLIFPTGVPPTPRWRYLIWFIGLSFLLGLSGIWTSSGEGIVPFINPDKPSGPFVDISRRLGDVGIGVIFAAIPVSLVSLFDRYRRADMVVRQQLKWLVFGATLSIAILISDFIYTFPGVWEPIKESLSFLLFPLSVAIAILRYRLFDIDVIIRRTLQYSLLTGVLSLVYFGGVALLQGILTADRGPQTAGGTSVSGPPSAAVIVLTTLAIAALFNPLRRRLQDFIDRRFYRLKYDAEKALAEFSAVARSGNDLAQLSERLTTTVQETLQPQHISLWLKPAATVLRSGSNPTGES